MTRTKPTTEQQIANFREAARRNRERALVESHPVVKEAMIDLAATQERNASALAIKLAR